MSHFYDSKGNPVYEVERSDGKGVRPTTIADARKLKLYGGVTEIIGQLDKGWGLGNWERNILLDTIIDSVYESKNFDDKNKWKKIILADYEERRILATGRDRGTELHDRIEQVFLTGELDEDKEYVEPVLNLLRETLGAGIKVAQTEKSFAHPSGFGGKVDLCGRYLPWDTTGFVIDFKTKSKEELDKSMFYDEHCMQLAAYRIGLDLPEAKCYNLYISTLKPGVLLIKEWTEGELQRGEKMFKALLEFWKLRNNL